MKQKAGIASSGAGYLIPIEAGAWAAILERLDVRQVAGASAGSICSALVALGHDGDSLHDLVMHADFAAMLQWRIWGCWNGLASNEPLHAWLDEVTQGQTMVDTTLPLTCVCSDVVTQKGWAFTSRSTPDVPIALAVLASAAIPFVYPSVQWQDKFLVDGGVRNNLPVDKLNRRYQRIGIMVQESVKSGPISGKMDESSRLIGMMLSANEGSREAWAASNGVPIIGLPAGNLSYLDAGMVVAERETLFQKGYNAVTAWLATPEGAKWLASP